MSLKTGLAADEDEFDTQWIKLFSHQGQMLLQQLAVVEKASAHEVLVQGGLLPSIQRYASQFSVPAKQHRPQPTWPRFRKGQWLIGRPPAI
jgi:hypothetical protein